MTFHKSLVVALLALPILGGCASSGATTATTTSAASSSQATSTATSFFNAASNMMSGVSLITSAATGKGLVELAIDSVTGKDCRFDSIIRENRKFCEERGSLATKDDFKGLIGVIQDYQDERERVVSSALTGVPEENTEYLMSGLELQPNDIEVDSSFDIGVDRIEVTTDLLNYNANIAVADFGIARTYDFTNKD